jgi:phosphatidylglycerol---prolipoprotein diacylglyceryl transferase
MGNSTAASKRMHPLLFDAIPLYFAAWVCAAITALVLGACVAAHSEFPAGRSMVGIALLAVSILLGSKLLYLAEARWFPFDDYVPTELRGSLHGFRIPGGIVLLAVALPVVCRALGLSWRRFGDTVIPLAAVALVFIRLGCFLNGCCFGKISGLPWAIAFPRESWVFWYHRAHGWVPRAARASLPVHPLQLYFLIAALLTLVLLVWQHRRASYPGYTQLLFYTLFFGSTAVLEPLRQNYLTLNNWLCPVAAVVAGGVLLGRTRALSATRVPVGASR